MEAFAETLLKFRERFIGKQREQWSLDDWRRTAEILAMALDGQVILANEAIQYAKEFRDYKPPKPRRGRPRARPGLSTVKSPCKPKGRRPEKNRSALAVAVYMAAQREKELLRGKGLRVTDKAAIENILRRLASQQKGPKRQSTRNFIDKRYWRVRKLLTEGKKIVSESGR